VLVSSFNPWALRLWIKRAPHVPAGLLFEEEAPLPLRRAWAAAWLRPFGLNPQFSLCSRDRVARWHAAGRFVTVWTVDAPAELRACREMGVDAVITNDPAAARAVLEAPPPIS
jgi:glycerophosphoryl diester phosphodiesterase